MLKWQSDILWKSSKLCQKIPIILIITAALLRRPSTWWGSSIHSKTQEAIEHSDQVGKHKMSKTISLSLDYICIFLWAALHSSSLSLKDLPEGKKQATTGGQKFNQVTWQFGTKRQASLLPTARRKTLYDKKTCTEILQGYLWTKGLVFRGQKVLGWLRLKKNLTLSKHSCTLPRLSILGRYIVLSINK